MPSFQQFTAEVSEKKYLNSKVLFLRLKLISPAEINFVAGQYVTLILSPTLRRSYSIFSSVKQKDAIDLIIDVTPVGPGTTFIKNMNMGQKIDFLGPLGHFTVETSANNIFFIATGTGFSPICCMLQSLIPEKIKNYESVTVLYGVSFKENAVFYDQCKAFAAQFQSFHYIPCVSRETVADGFHGHVTDYLKQNEATIPFSTSHFFICGGRDMVNDVTSILTSKGVPQEQITTEKY